MMNPTDLGDCLSFPLGPLASWHFWCLLKLVQCPFKTCLFGTGWLRGLRYCCMQLSQEPLFQTTSHSTLHFLGSSATHPPSVKLIGWMFVKIIKGQTEAPSILVRLVQDVSGPIAWLPVLLLAVLSRGVPVWGVAIWNGQLLGPGSAACSVVENCSMRITHLIDFTLDTALPWVLCNTPAKCEVGSDE